MKYVVMCSRWVVGLLFIFSGWVKLNDPVGFSFKLEEYFSPSVLDIPWLVPGALALALVLVVFEVLLGVALLMGFAPKWTLYSLTGMIVFFTFLTFYSAYFNKVTDCGCFGDAIPLTPWQSFYKDVVLVVLIGFLWLGQSKLGALSTHKTRIILMLLSLFGALYYGYYVLNHLPLVDFRAYKVGTHVPSAMEIPEDAPQAIYAYEWFFEHEGKTFSVTTDKAYPQVTGTFVRVETRMVQAGYEPPIHDFSMEQDGVDYTQELLSQERLMLVVLYDLRKTDWDFKDALIEKVKEAQDLGYKVVGLSASDASLWEVHKPEEGWPFPLYFSDQTTLKTIIRSNPGLVVLHRGTITDKKHINDINYLAL